MEGPDTDVHCSGVLVLARNARSRTDVNVRAGDTTLALAPQKKNSWQARLPLRNFEAVATRRFITQKMPRKSSASKRELNGDLVVTENRPQKKAKLLDHTDDEDSEAETGAGFKVNEEYARRFEHNKKRAEQHRRQYYSLQLS